MSRDKKPLPIALSTVDCYAEELRSMADSIRRDPMGFRCGVILDGVGAARTIQIGHGSSRISIPVFDEWPLSDLSPHGMSSLLDELHRDCARRAGDVNAQSAELEPMASYALALAVAQGNLPEDFPYETDGSVEIEVCIEGDRAYAFWVQLDDAASTPYKLKVDERHLQHLAGVVPIPCHMWSVSDHIDTMDCIGQSASDDEGIYVRARPLDAMQTLRMHRMIQDGNEP